MSVAKHTDVSHHDMGSVDPERTSQTNSKTKESDASKQSIFLTPGTAVSAKYRGAFCEASVDQIDLRYRLRVQLKKDKTIVCVDQSAVVCDDPTVGREIVVHIPNPRAPASSSNLSTAVVERIGTVLRVTDTSLYTVIFDDGDKRTLRRTQLVIKGERHFKESESLDSLPLTNPEQFRQPVIDQRRKLQRSGDEEVALDGDDGDDYEYGNRDRTQSFLKPVSHSSATVNTGCPRTAADKGMVQSVLSRVASNTANKSEPVTEPHASSPSAKPSSLEEEEEEISSLPSACYYRLLGRLVLFDPSNASNNKDSTSSTVFSPSNATTPSTHITDHLSAKRRMVPALVVLPSAMPSIDLKGSPVASRKMSTKVPKVLVRSFKDNRFSAVSFCKLTHLKRPCAVELANSTPHLRTALERAILWLDRYELPASWGDDALQALLGSKNWRSAKHLYRHRAIQQSSIKLSSSSVRRRPSAIKSSSTTELASDDKVASVNLPSSLPRKRLRQSESGPLSTVKSKRQKRSITSRDDSSDHSSRSRERRASKDAKRNAFVEAKHKGDSDSSSGSNDTPSEDESSKSDMSDLSDSSSTDASSTTSSSSSSSSPSSSSASLDFEERDRWIAQLYRFMDEGGTPINKAPCLANKDLDLYKLFKLVRNLGGFHRVTTQFKWGYIYSKLHLPHHAIGGPRLLQAAFKRYLYPLDDANRKLGTDLSELPLSRPRHLPASNAPIQTSSTSKPTVTPSSLKGVSTGTSANSKPLLTAGALADKKSTVTKETSSDRQKVERTTLDSYSSPPVLSPPFYDRVASPQAEDPLDSNSTSASILPVCKSPQTEGVTVNLSSVSDLKRKPNLKRTDGTDRDKQQTDKKSAVDASSSISKRLEEAKSTTSTPLVKCTLTSEKKSSTNASSTKNASASALTSSNQSVTSSSAQPSIEKIHSLGHKFPENDGLETPRTLELNQIIPIGSRVRVRCGDRAVYEAKILKHIRPQTTALFGLSAAGGAVDDSLGGTKPESALSPSWLSSPEMQYRVHYMGWNQRHDEVVAKSRIQSVIEWAHPPDSARPPSCSSLNVIVHQESRRPLWSDSKATPDHSSNSRSSSGATRQASGRERNRGDDDDSFAYHEDELSDDQSPATETASDIVTTISPMVRRRAFGLESASAAATRRAKVRARAAITRTSESTRPPIIQSASSGKTPTPSANVSDYMKHELKRELDEGDDSMDVTLSTPIKRSRQVTSTRSPKSSNTGADVTKFQNENPVAGLTEPSSPVLKVEEQDEVASSQLLKTVERGINEDGTKRTKTASAKHSSATTVPSGGSKSTEQKSKQSDHARRRISGDSPLTRPTVASLSKQQQKATSKATKSNTDPRSNLPSGSSLKSEKSKKPNQQQQSIKPASSSIESSTSSASVKRSQLCTGSDVSTLKKPRSLANTETSNNKSSNVKGDSTKSKISFPSASSAVGSVTKQASKKASSTVCVRPLEFISSTVRSSRISSSSSSDSDKEQQDRPGDEQVRSTTNSFTSKRNPLLIDPADTEEGKSECQHAPPSTIHDLSDDGGKQDDVSSIHSSIDSNHGSNTSLLSDFGTMDALPRLTRSQHRQLLGDTPPGAILRTASPVQPHTTATTGLNTDAISSEPPAKPTAVSEPILEDHNLDETRHLPRVSKETARQKLKSTDSSVRSEPKSSTEKETTAKLRPRTKVKTEPRPTAVMQQSETEESAVCCDETDEQNDESDEVSSTNTASTEPMTGKFPEVLISCGSHSASSSSSDVTESVNAINEAPISGTSNKNRKQATITATADSNESTNAPVRSPIATRSGKSSSEAGASTTVEEQGEEEEVETAQQTDEILVSLSKSRDRTSITSTKTRSRQDRSKPMPSGSDNSSRKAQSRRNFPTPTRSHLSNQSPIRASMDSPRRSPNNLNSPIIHSSTNASVNTGVSSSSSGAGSIRPAAPTGSRLAPLQRRFGGPFYPVEGLEVMSTEVRCQVLQDRMYRIVEAWRLAKSCLKDTDQRSNRTRRQRAKQNVDTHPVSHHLQSQQQPNVPLSGDVNAAASIEDSVLS